MITFQDRRNIGIYISLEEFIKMNQIHDRDLAVLEDKYSISKKDAYETLYVIYTQGDKYSNLDKILKVECKNILHGEYLNVARHLFNDSAYAEYVNETR